MENYDCKIVLKIGYGNADYWNLHFVCMKFLAKLVVRN